MRLLLERISRDNKQTLGRFFVLDKEDFSEWDCATLELPWKRNLRNVSCIPVGKYKVIKHVSPTFGRSFWIQDVPDRAEVLIHAGNFYSNTRGCILPGLDTGDINADGKLDVKHSKKALSKLLALLPDEFELEIINGMNIDE